ncbi:MAG: hypothetical protein IT581_12860 [Verrucomicrobiales bacterium]|nr:hypothetical protein [Verrucomicrobiales bacterium]
MNTPTQTVLTEPSDRRKFLRRMGGLGAAASAVAASRSAFAGSSEFAHRFQLTAEGTVDDFTLVWPAPTLPQLPDGTIIRVRIQFPVNGRDIVEWSTFLAPANAPSQSLAVLTLFHLGVEKIILSDEPTPNFCLAGRVLDNPIIDNPNHSPFGDLTGHAGMIYGGFDKPGNQTTFTLLGGAAAGSHASALRTAYGSLRYRGNCRSF